MYLDFTDEELVEMYPRILSELRLSMDKVQEGVEMSEEEIEVADAVVQFCVTAKSRLDGCPIEDAYMLVVRDVSAGSVG